MSKIIELMSAKDIRETLEGLPCPICTEGFSDSLLYDLQVAVITELIQRFGTLDISEAPKLEDAWWSVLENVAVIDYEMKYYEDMEE